MAASIAYVYVLLGLALGATRSILGLGIFVGFVAVAPSLPWQLGLENLAYPLFYSVGLIVGGWLSDRARGDDRQTESLARVAHLGVATVCVVTFIALARNDPLRVGNLSAALADGVRDLALFNPRGLAGFTQAALVPIIGMLLFLMALRGLRDGPARDLFERAFMAGAMLTAASPVVQLLLLDPTVRPDKNLDRAEGIVGFFQDPHSFAAYLVLAIGLLLGIAAERRLGASQLQRRRALLAAAAAVILWVELLYTNSRSGLLASAVCVFTFVTAYWALAPEEQVVRARRLKIAGALAATVLLIAAAAFFSLPVRGALYQGLSTIGNQRMWAVLDPEGPADPLMARRVTLWRKGVELTLHHPLWGVGPQGFVDTGFDTPALAPLLEKYARDHSQGETRFALQELPEENAHNYYIQYAAEFGVPALLALLTLLGMVAVVTSRGIARRGSKGRALLAGVAAGQAGFLAIGLLSHPLLLAEMQGLFWSTAAFGIAVALEPDDAGPDHRQG